jgi:UDP-N-acetylglucosamine--dolichyl-phosphate N-acetylglucosaminephosphotransferase
MILLGASLLAGFLTVLIGTPYLEKYLLSSGIYGIDQQKEEKPKLATSGGIGVVFGFMISVTTYLGFYSLTKSSGIDISLVLASLSSVSVIALIGMIDDIHINLEKYIREEVEIDEFRMELGESTKMRRPQISLERLRIGFLDEKEDEDVHREGLAQNAKMLFVLPAVLPLIAVGAGSWSMTFPVIGTVNWGLIYPLALLPLGLLFVSNVVNMLAGTNGLSAGMSLVASTALGVFALMNGETEAALIAWSLSSSLLAFFLYNRYPAKILPGDSLTYLSGAAMFAAIVAGNMEKFGVFIFTPWILEFFLKLRSGFNARSWGKLREDGSLDSFHDRIYSLTHVFMHRGFTEKQITYSLMGIEAAISVLGLILFGVLGVL